MATTLKNSLPTCYMFRVWCDYRHSQQRLHDGTYSAHSCQLSTEGERAIDIEQYSLDWCRSRVRN